MAWGEHCGKIDLNRSTRDSYTSSLPEVGDTLERAAVLARQNRPGQPTFGVIGGLGAFYLVRADHRRANQLANKMLEIAATEKSKALATGGHFVLGASLFWLGRFAESLEHLRLGSSVTAKLNNCDLGPYS